MLRGPVKPESFWRVAVDIFAHLHRRRLSFLREASVFIEEERGGMSREEYIWSAEETWYISIIIL